jgi:hypothetical protein
MSGRRVAAQSLAVLAAVVALPMAPALASGGPGGGGGGGVSAACAPLTMAVKVVHADGNGNSSVNVQATIRDCSSVPQPVRLDVSIPGSGTVPFRFSSGGASLAPGASLTMSASTIGSTPSQLHFGQTYSVVGTLTRTGPTSTTLATISTPVTMPPSVVG